MRKNMNAPERGNSGRVVTVIGGGGFIGRALVARLVAAGHVVRVAVRNPAKLEALTRAPGEGRVELIKASVVEGNSLAAAFDRADAVVNLVSIMDPDVQKMREINVYGAQRAARVAHECGVARYIHASAIGASLNSPSAYGRSKGEAERVVRTAFPGASLIRPSVVFGPRDSFMNMFALIAKLSPIVPVFASKTRFQPVYVGDVAEAIVRLLGASEGARTVEAGGPDVFTMRELMEFVLDATNRKRLLLSVPGFVARLEGKIFEKLPGHILTSDQVAMMGVDNVVHSGVDTLTSLGIDPVSLKLVGPSYLGGSVFESWRRFFS
ncbi:complex I NDUFA9 subunit family protein [Gluconobacter wancherniae]|nr:complex I NDUFA9 subunit family protein [Gluconobacter wancherniae]